MTQGSQSQRSATAGGIEKRGGFRREGTHVCLWPVHTDVLQKLSQYCNYPPIIFFKEIKSKKKKRKRKVVSTFQG